MSRSRPPLRRLVKRFGRRAIDGVRPWAVHAGLARYRSGPWARQCWNDNYTSGHLDYFASRSEQPRYSVLVGYLAGLGHPRHVLDIGCGQGVLFDRARHVPFVRWSGVDLAAAAVERAQLLADHRAHFTIGDLLDPAWVAAPDGYDVVVLNEVLNMCNDPEAMLCRVATLLTPHGVLLVSGWHHIGDRALWRLIDNVFDEVDATEVRSTTSTLAPRGWRVAVLKAR